MPETKQNLVERITATIPGAVDDTIVRNAVDMSEGGGIESGEPNTPQGNVSAAIKYLSKNIPDLDDDAIERIKEVFRESARNHYH